MRLGVSAATIRRRVADGSLRAVKLGESRNCAVRIPRSALDEWLARGRDGGTSRVTAQDLQTRGWARTFTGFWLSPDGLRILSEADALAEIPDVRSAFLCLRRCVGYSGSLSLSIAAGLGSSSLSILGVLGSPPRSLAPVVGSPSLPVLGVLRPFAPDSGGPGLAACLGSPAANGGGSRPSAPRSPAASAARTPCTARRGRLSASDPG